jgi:hypothetical protein
MVDVLDRREGLDGAPERLGKLFQEPAVVGRLEREGLPVCLEVLFQDRHERPYK